jgi:glycosyltransferase involved in cell wall biosynthesis
LPAVVFVANHQTQLSDKAGVKRLLGLARKRRRLVKELGGLIAMSKVIYEELKGYGIPEDKIAQIPMGVNTRIFFPAESEAAKSDSRSELGWLDLPTIIFVGGVVRRKRPDLIIDALHILKDRGLDCQLVIVGPEGDAAYSKEMRARATEYHVTDRVVWYGFAKDISRLFRAADYFCLPSSNEGMSAALIEAMASGLPAIVTPISGSTDAVEDDKSGRFVHADANMIADVVGEYVCDSRLAKLHGMAARQRVEERFSSEAVFSAYERLFRRIMAGKSAAE